MMNADTADTRLQLLPQQRTARITMLAVLGAETSFFSTAVMVYLFLRTQAGGELHTWTLPVIPLFNTIILLLSAFAAWRSLVAIRHGKPLALQTGLVMTLLPGCVFIVGQIIEFSRSGIQGNDAAFGGIYLTLIGFHAAHVIAGMVILALNLVRTRHGDFSASRYVAVEVGTWFWYYVVGVWLVLFTVLYLVQG